MYADLTDRAAWFRRAEKNRIERYRVNTEKPICPGAPNLSDPIIADLIYHHTPGRGSGKGKQNSEVKHLDVQS